MKPTLSTLIPLVCGAEVLYMGLFLFLKNVGTVLSEIDHPSIAGFL